MLLIVLKHWLNYYNNEYYGISEYHLLHISVGAVVRTSKTYCYIVRNKESMEVCYEKKRLGVMNKGVAKSLSICLA